MDPVGSLSSSRISSSATPTVTQHRAGRDQRAAVRRRAQQLEQPLPDIQIPGFGTGPSPE